MRTFLAVKHANGEGNQAFNLQYMKEWLELLEFQQKILRIGRLKAFNVISTQILNESLIYSIRGCFVIFATHFKHLLFAGERIYEIKKGRGGGSTEPKLKEVGVTFSHSTNLFELNHWPGNLEMPHSHLNFTTFKNPILWMVTSCFLNFFLPTQLSKMSAPRKYILTSFMLFDQSKVQAKIRKFPHQKIGGTRRAGKCTRENSLLVTQSCNIGCSSLTLT